MHDQELVTAVIIIMYVCMYSAYMYFFIIVTHVHDMYLDLQIFRLYSSHTSGGVSTGHCALNFAN